MWKGTLVSIYITSTAKAPLASVSEARVVPGKGIEGDRYFDGRGTYSNHPGTGREVTLIEMEAIEAARREYNVAIQPQETRRNLITRGVPLNHLVDREFCVGEARLKGLRLCEPCSHLEGLTRQGVKAAFVHRGGLRSVVVGAGTIRAGDAIEEILPSKTDD
jgi:MOSC domain-containing protein YiiM